MRLQSPKRFCVLDVAGRFQNTFESRNQSTAPQDCLWFFFCATSDESMQIHACAVGNFNTFFQRHLHPEWETEALRDLSQVCAEGIAVRTLPDERSPRTGEILRQGDRFTAVEAGFLNSSLTFVFRSQATGSSHLRRVWFDMGAGERD